MDEENLDKIFTEINNDNEVQAKQIKRMISDKKNKITLLETLQAKIQGQINTLNIQIDDLEELLEKY